jgi:non-ribosomal peptide synthetase component F
VGRNTRPRRDAGPADRLREHARRRADHVAIDALAPDGAALRWTWGTLERRVDALARRLVASGVRGEVPVGVCATRGPDLVEVPNVVGESINDAIDILEAAGFVVTLDTNVPPGLRDSSLAAVQSTNPAAGERILRNSAVTVVANY